ncbi:respiratory nitrate reductase subunit gamma [Cupriavidus basilensis]
MARSAARAGIPRLARRARGEKPWNPINQFLFGIYPYIALAAIFLFGSLAASSASSTRGKPTARRSSIGGNLRTGNILFHVGILGLFFGHLNRAADARGGVGRARRLARASSRPWR